MSNIPTTSNSTNLNDFPTLTQQQLPEIKDPKQQINFTTHNIRGLNNSVKLQNWIEYCIRENLHLVALSETKLKSKPTSLTNPLYKFYTSNFIPSNPLHRETALGTALMVHKSIQLYIHNINSLLGSAIYIDFFFSNNNKTRVISVYLLTNHLQLLKST